MQSTNFHFFDHLNRRSCLLISDVISSLCNDTCAGLQMKTKNAAMPVQCYCAQHGVGGGGDRRAWSNGGMMTPGNRTNSENLLLCHFVVHLRSHLESCGTEPKDLRWEASFQQFQLWHSKFKINIKKVHNFQNASFSQVVSVPTWHSGSHRFDSQL
jgi:hypothetical protein